ECISDVDGYDELAHLCVPERDHAGRIIGISKCYQDDSKRQVPGSRRGLCYSQDMLTSDGPIIIVEGASDTAAGLTLGITSIIGRPSHTGGVEPPAKRLAEPAKAGRQIIVLGENDRKADGTWPGQHGAVTVAQQLADAWGVPVLWSMPPDGAKDLRAWLN